jgi:hypothetical protein
MTSPQLFELHLHQGSDFEAGPMFLREPITGDPIASSDGWSAVCTVRSVFDGTEIVVVGAGGAGTAAFEGDDADALFLRLPGTATSGLPATETIRGISDGYHLADLVIARTTPTVEQHHVCDFIVHVHRKATSA